jgi:hypothetical protein
MADASYSGPERRGKQWLTVAQVARVLGYTPQTVTAYLREKRLPGMCIKRSWRIDPIAFRAELDRLWGGSRARDTAATTPVPAAPPTSRRASTAATVREPGARGPVAGYSGRDRRGREPITVERAAHALRKTPAEVLALADRFELCGYRRGSELVFPPSRFRESYPFLVRAS